MTGAEDQAQGLRTVACPQFIRPFLVMDVCGRRGPSVLLRHLGTFFAEYCSSVLLIDEHAIPDNLCRYFQVKARFDLAQVLTGDCTLHHSCQLVQNGLYLLPASRYARDSQRSQNLFPLPWKHTFCKLYVEPTYPSWIFVDSVSAPANLAGYGFSHWILLIVVTPEFRCYKTILSQLAQVAVLIKQVVQVELVVMGCVTDNHQKIDDIISSIGRFCEEEVGVSFDFCGFLPEDRSLHSATILHRPVYQLFPDSASSKAIHHIARVLFNQFNEHTAVPDVYHSPCVI